MDHQFTMMFPFVIVALGTFVLGACIGSFLNVCIYRIPRELSIVTPRSHCPHCERKIPWRNNVPLVSFIVLRAKCRYCGGRISARYFIVELLVAILFLLIWLKLDFPAGARPLKLAPITDWKLVPVYWLVVSGLVLGTFVDFEHMIIPDRVTLGGIAAGILLSVLAPSLHGEERALLGLAWALAGALFGWTLLWGVGRVGKLIFRKDAMGFGDVKLLGAIGAFMGVKATLFTVIVSSLAGSLAGVALVLLGRKKMQSRIPYGPYIALGAALWILWGPIWWQAYIDLMTPTM